MTTKKGKKSCLVVKETSKIRRNDQQKLRCAHSTYSSQIDLLADLEIPQSKILDLAEATNVINVSKRASPRMKLSQTPQAYFLCGLLLLLLASQSIERYLYKNYLQPDFPTGVSPATQQNVNEIRFARGQSRNDDCILGAVFGMTTTRFYSINRITGIVSTYGTPPNDRYEAYNPSDDLRQFIDHLPNTNYWFVTQAFGTVGNAAKLQKLDIQLNSKTLVTEKTIYLLQSGILIRDSLNSNLFLTVERASIGETNYRIRTYLTTANPPTIQQVLDLGTSAITLQNGIYLESANAVAISKRSTPGTTVMIYTFNPSIIQKQSLALTVNPGYPGSPNFLTMSEVVSTKRLLVLGSKAIVDIWDISNLDSVTLVSAYYLDSGDPALKLHDNLYAFKDSTKFFVSELHASLYSIKRFDYTLPTPGIISVSKEFENINGSGTEFLHINRRSAIDDHEDIIVAWTRLASGDPYDQRIYSFQSQCNYLLQNGPPICYDCYSDQKIAASTLAKCTQVSTVRFFTYKVTQNAAKTDDGRNFHGILTLENFDINTDVVSNLQTWLQTNMVLNPTLSGFTPSVIFESVPSNRTPTGDSKIALPFKIQLASDLTSDQTVLITFATQSIVQSFPTFMNMAQMVDAPQSLVAKFCNPQTQISHNGTCKDCNSDSNIATTTLALCSSLPERRFFTYKVAKDTLQTDDLRNFFGILTLENFDINTDVVTNLRVWLQTNMVLNPDLTANSPSIIFDPVPVNRTPTGDSKIPLPFKIQLGSDLASTTTVGITFGSSSIVNTPPTYMNLAAMVSQPQSLVLAVGTSCDPYTQVLQGGSCSNCGTDTQIMTSTPAICNQYANSRFFTYKVTQDNSKTDDEQNFHGILTLENFNVNTNLFSDLKIWFQNHLTLLPNLSANGPSVIFDIVNMNRSPTTGDMIDLPFKIQLTTPLTSTQSIAINFSSYRLVDSNPTYFNLVQMVGVPQSLAFVVCSKQTQVSNSGTCKNCDTESSLSTNTPSLCNSLPQRRFFTYRVAKDLSKIDDIRQFHGVLTLENFNINTNLVPGLKLWLETNIRISPNMVAYSPVIYFENVTTNRTPTGDNEIQLPFRIQLGSSFIGSQNLSIDFAINTIRNDPANQYNMVTMTTTPTVSILGCDPDSQVLDVLSCRQCQTQSQITATTPAVCNAQSKVRFFRFSVTATPANDTPTRFHAQLALSNFNVNTDEVVSFQNYLQTQIQVSGLTPYSPTVQFNAVPINRAATGDGLITLPFYIELNSELTTDSTSTISFQSPLIYSSYPAFFRMVEMDVTPQTLNFKACDQTSEALKLGMCLPCSTQADITTSTPLACNSWGLVRFFTYTVTKTLGVDDLQNFHATLTLENFDVNTNLIPSLKTWLETNMELTPNLSSFSPLIVFDAIPANRNPTLDKKISLPFKIQLAQDLDVDTSITVSFTNFQIMNSSPHFFNIVSMTPSPGITLSTVQIPVIQLEWLIKGISQKTAQVRILQTLENNEHLVEFEIKNYSLSLDLIRDHLDFFETEFSVQFENPADSGVTAQLKRTEWSPRQESGNLFFNFKVVLGDPLINTRNEVSRVKINLADGISNRIVTNNTILEFPTKPEALIVELYPSKKLSKKTQEYLDQKPDTAITNFAQSSSSKAIMMSLAAIGIVGSAAGFCSIGFMNIGSAIIKLFIIIELIGKFLHLPIWYKGALLETLYTLAQFSDLVQLKPETFVNSSKDDQIRKSRYWTKFTVYEEYNNVLQAVPLSCIILISLILIQGILKLIEGSRSCCKSKSQVSNEQETQKDIKTLIHGAGKLQKFKNFIGQIKLSMIESTFIDIIFSSCYNLITDYRSSYPLSHVLGKTLAVFFLSIIIWRYFYLLETASCQPWKLTLYETKMLLENLDKESAQKGILVRSMNIVFRLKIVFLLACIVMLQNQVYACMVIMLLAQVGFFIKLLVGKIKYKKVFNGWIPFLNYFVIEVTITLLVTICLALFSTQPKAKEYQESQKEVEVSLLETVANTALVILIISSILIEFFNLIREIFFSIKKCLQKKKKQQQLEKAKTFVRMESMRMPTIKMPTMRLLTKTFTVNLHGDEQTPVPAESDYDPQLSIERNIEAQQKEIEVLEKDLVQKDKMEKIIDFWRHASVLTKIKKELKAEAEKVTTEIKENNSEPDVKENHPSRLQNFMQRMDPEEDPAKVSDKDQQFRARYFKRKKTLNQINTATRRRSKWQQVSEMVADQKISLFAVNNLNPTKPSLAGDQSKVKMSTEQERIKMTSCENDPSNFNKAAKEQSGSLAKQVKELKQDSFDSNTSSESESENEKEQDTRSNKMDSEMCNSKRGLLQSQKSIIVRQSDSSYAKQKTLQFKKFQEQKPIPKKKEIAGLENLGHGPESSVNITVNSPPFSPLRKSPNKKQTIVRFDDDQVQELERRDRLRRLNTEKKASGSKNSLGSSFGDDESQNKGEEFEESGIIIKNLVRINTTADVDYSIANSPTRRKKADDSVTNMGSVISGFKNDSTNEFNFKQAVFNMELDDSKNSSPPDKNKGPVNGMHLPIGVSPVRGNRLALKLAQHRQFQNTPPVDKFDQSLFTAGSQAIGKDSAEFDQGQTMESPQRSLGRISSEILSSQVLQNNFSGSEHGKNAENSSRAKISIFGREKKSQGRRRRIASEALNYNKFEVIDEKSVEHQPTTQMDQQFNQTLAEVLRLNSGKFTLLGLPNSGILLTPKQPTHQFKPKFGAPFSHSIWHQGKMWVFSSFDRSLFKGGNFTQLKLFSKIIRTLHDFQVAVCLISAFCLEVLVRPGNRSVAPSFWCDSEKICFNLVVRFAK